MDCRRSLFLLFASGLCACPGEPAAGPDAQHVRPDAFHLLLDAGVVEGPDAEAEAIDASEARDSSSARTDASRPDAAAIDSGAFPDAARPADVGAPVDAATPADASMLVDAGAPGQDAGPQPDPGMIGANVYELLFYYLGLEPGGPARAQAVLDDAKAQGLGHVRFIATGFWPTNMTTGSGWRNDPASYWAAFDALMSDAEARGIRLVPSVVWNLSLFPDLVGEPIGKLMEPGSASRSMAEQYVTEVVTRYRGRPAILFWELGNEWNLSADIDITCDDCASPSGKCGLWPTLGTPCKRTAADNIFSCNPCRGVSSAQQDLGQFASAMASLIRGLDPAHSVSSGFGYPRPAAWHLAAHPCPACDWTADSPADVQAALAQTHRAPIDVVSVHHYPGDDLLRFGSPDPSGDGYLAQVRADVTAMGMRLYVGEFGEMRARTVSCGTPAVCGGDPAQVLSRLSADAFLAHGVDFAAVWTFGKQDCPGQPACMTVTVTDDQPMLAMFREHNAAVTACAGQPDQAACPVGQCASGRCAPVALASFLFHSSGDTSGWVHWANCSSCVPEDFVFHPESGGFVELASHDLPCSGACQYPGAYLLSPVFPVQPGHALVRVVSRSSGDASALIISADSAGNPLSQDSVAVYKGADGRTGAIWSALPSGAVSARVRLDLSSPDSTLDLQSVSVEWQP